MHCTRWALSWECVAQKLMHGHVTWIRIHYWLHPWTRFINSSYPRGAAPPPPPHPVQLLYYGIILTLICAIMVYMCMGLIWFSYLLGCYCLCIFYFYVSPSYSVISTCCGLFMLSTCMHVLVSFVVIYISNKVMKYKIMAGPAAWVNSPESSCLSSVVKLPKSASNSKSSVAVSFVKVSSSTQFGRRLPSFFCNKTIIIQHVSFTLKQIKVWFGRGCYYPFLGTPGPTTQVVICTACAFSIFREKGYILGAQFGKKIPKNRWNRGSFRIFFPKHF